MKIVENDDVNQVVKGKIIYLDNDFLALLYANIDIQNKILPAFKTGIILLDYLTKFEFLRDVYLPEQKTLKEKFVQSDLFIESPNRQEIFIKLQQNALILSLIYAHQHCDGKASIVDLILGARLLLNPDNTLLITGNRKDYPNCIFDLAHLIPVEDDKGQVRNYYILKFNLQNFNKCFKLLEDLSS